MSTEEIVGAEPTTVEPITEEVVEADSTLGEEVVESSTTEEVSDDGWGAVRPEDTLSDELSIETTEEAITAGKEGGEEKTPVQKRIDALTREKKELQAREAQTRNTNNFLMQELNKHKHAVAKSPPSPEVKEPVFEEYEEKYADNPDKANREYLKDHQAYLIKQSISVQKQEEAIKTRQANMATTSQAFTTGSYSEQVLKKYPNFHEVVFHPTVIFNDEEVRHLIMSSPQKYDLAFRLAKDEQLRNRINNSSPAMAGAIIGDLQRLYASPVNKRFKTKAAKPITPVGTENKALEPKEEDMDIDAFLIREDKKRIAAEGW
jgi:hypothetical protein